MLASAIRAVEATGGATSASDDFSAEGPKKLGDVLEAGYDDIADTATAVSDTVGSIPGTVGRYTARGAAAGRQFFCRYRPSAVNAADRAFRGLALAGLSLPL